MKLYHNPASPFVRKVLVVAHECGIEDQIQLQQVALTPVSPDTGLNGDNPLGKIPALVLDNGDTLFDSRVICEYLNTTFGGTLFPENAKQRWITLRHQSLGDGFCDAAVLVRYEGFVRPEDRQWQEWVDAQLNKCRRTIDLLEKECVGFDDVPDIGTLSIAIALAYFDFRNPDEEWRKDAPALAEWYQRMAQRESLMKTRPA